MGNSYKRHLLYLLGMLVFAIMFSPIYAESGGGAPGHGVMLAKLSQVPLVAEQAPVYLDMSDPRIKAAAAVQEHNKKYLLGLPDVVGTAIGVNDDGEAAIQVFTKRKAALGVLPSELEGVRVVEKVTGEIVAMKRHGGGGINPAGRFPRPVPIGVSTGNATASDCATGTISARLKSAGGVYALSNNHVYALENTAANNSQILQPGLFDTSCIFDPNNVIGTLTAFVPINFSGGNNTVDAAIAFSNTTSLGNSTPLNGYGTPNSTTIGPSFNLPVQKYGRTTSLTHGTITGINATVIVNYGTSGNATFVNQITVGSSGSFIRPGDSGSLLVTNDANDYPVGLLFAGNSSGTFAVANQIGDVLTAFSGYGVSIDGK